MKYNNERKFLCSGICAVYSGRRLCHSTELYIHSTFILPFAGYYGRCAMGIPSTHIAIEISVSLPPEKN